MPSNATSNRNITGTMAAVINVRYNDAVRFDFIDSDLSDNNKVMIILM
jgi:hypothetical protein